MNELKQHRLAKQYQDYYKSYNSGFRQLDEKKPESVHQGVVTWNETDINKPLLKAVK